VFFLHPRTCIQLRLQQGSVEQLKSDIARERQLRTGAEAIRNAEYLKHVVLKWMLSPDRNEQAALLPVIAEMLQFSDMEGLQVGELLGRGAFRRVAGGFKNLLLGPGT